MNVEGRVLGPVRLVVDATEVTPYSAKERLLLAHLLVASGRAVSSKELIAQLWGGDAPRNAHASLQSLISRLRRHIAMTGSDGAPLIRYQAGRYALTISETALDSYRFTAGLDRAWTAWHRADPAGALREVEGALALWSGPAFAGLTRSEGHAPFEDLRVLLEEERLDALLLKADATRAVGLHASAVADLRELVQKYPDQECVRERLALALHTPEYLVRTTRRTP